MACTSATESEARQPSPQSNNRRSTRWPLSTRTKTALSRPGSPRTVKWSAMPPFLRVAHLYWARSGVAGVVGRGRLLAGPIARPHGPPFRLSQGAGGWARQRALALVGRGRVGPGRGGLFGMRPEHLAQTLQRAHQQMAKAGVVGVEGCHKMLSFRGNGSCTYYTKYSTKIGEPGEKERTVLCLWIVARPRILPASSRRRGPGGKRR